MDLKQKSGVMKRLPIDASSPTSVSEALSALLEKYQGAFYEQGRVAFGVKHENGLTTIRPFFSFAATTQAEIEQSRLETYAFIKQVLGFANDPSGDIVYDDNGSPIELRSSASFQQLAVGMQKMLGVLNREKFTEQAL